MSSFLPDGFKNDGGQSLTPVVAADPSDSDIQLMQRVLRTAAARPHQMPAEFMAQIIDQIQVANLLLPISQIVGFQQFTANVAPTIGTSETTTSTTFTNLATVGPQLTGLPDGQYLALFGCEADTSIAGNVAAMALSSNGAALGSPPIGDDCESRVTDLVSISRAVTVSLSTGGNNSIVAKYATDNAGATASFSSRWLIALRYSNA